MNKNYKKMIIIVGGNTTSFYNVAIYKFFEISYFIDSMIQRNCWNTQRSAS